MLRLIKTGLCLLVGMICVSGRAEMSAVVNVLNKPNMRVEIIPLDEGHRNAVPPSILAVWDRLPPGAFLIRNRAETPITAIVVIWVYRSEVGEPVRRRINCDGYVFPPTRAVVKAKGMSLITPDSCTSEASFAALGNQIQQGDSPLASAKNRSILASRKGLLSVDLTIDSAIFENGEIWGPDKARYYVTIWERHLAMQAVLSEVADAQNKGESVDSRLEKIRSSAREKNDNSSALRDHFAGLLQNSPNREGTLSQFQSRSTLPEFHHTGEESQ